MLEKAINSVIKNLDEQNKEMKEKINKEVFKEDVLK